MKSSGAKQADAITDLRAYVLRAALYSLRRSRGNLGRLASTEVNQLAEERVASGELRRIIAALTQRIPELEARSLRARCGGAGEGAAPVC